MRDRRLVARQQPAQMLREHRLLQMARRYVDADSVMSSPSRSHLCELLDRMLQHPVAELDAQARVLDQRQELRGRDHALLGWRQRSRASKPSTLAVSHVDLGLEEQAELVVVECLLNPAERDETCFGAAVVLGVEEQVAVAAGLLRAVHRVVGMAQQRSASALSSGNTVAPMLAVISVGPAPTPSAYGLAYLVQHPFDRVAAFVERGGAQQQHELVAADARDDVVTAGQRAQRTAHPFGELDEQAVAGVVAEAVVDRLEMVEVEIADRQQRSFAAARLHRVGQHLRKASPVRQPGQFVEVGLALQLLELLARAGDVGDRDHMVTDLPFGLRLTLDTLSLQPARSRHRGAGRRARHARCRWRARLARIASAGAAWSEPGGAGRTSGSARCRASRRGDSR